MKVVLAITDTARGGAPNSLAELALAVRDLGHEPTVVSLMPSGPVAAALETRGIKTMSLDLRGPLDLAPAFFRFRRLLRSLKPDVLQTVLWHANVLGRLVAIGTGVPTVDCYQSVDDDKSGRRIWLDRATARRSLAHVCVSAAVAERAIGRERLERHRVEVIPVGKDPSAFAVRGVKGEVRARLGIPATARVVGWTGRMQTVKNVPVLIEGIARLEGVWGLLIGDGPQRAAVEEAIADAGVGKRVVLVGETDDVRPYLEAMDVFCLPSSWEGSSGSLAEAMLMELPVIATAVGGNPEMVEDGKEGVLLAEATPVAIASAYEQIVDGMGERGRLTAAQRFSVERMARDYVDVWERVVADVRVS
jgi:glycosyltransferase involved in cell wall biosynthesis